MKSVLYNLHLYEFMNTKESLESPVCVQGLAAKNDIGSNCRLAGRGQHTENVLALAILVV